MEYNTSARTPNTALKARLCRAASKADGLIAHLKAGEPDVDAVHKMVAEYLRMRYLLEPEDMKDDSLNYLGEVSLARSLGVSVNSIRKNELDSKCEGTSSSMTKKILLIISLNRALEIDISDTRAADITTVTELGNEVVALLLKSRAHSGS